MCEGTWHNYLSKVKKNIKNYFFFIFNILSYQPSLLVFVIFIFKFVLFLLWLLLLFFFFPKFSYSSWILLLWHSSSVGFLLFIYSKIKWFFFRFVVFSEEPFFLFYTNIKILLLTLVLEFLFLFRILFIICRWNNFFYSTENF